MLIIKITYVKCTLIFIKSQIKSPNTRLKIENSVLFLDYLEYFVYLRFDKNRIKPLITNLVL